MVPPKRSARTRVHNLQSSRYYRLETASRLRPPIFIGDSQPLLDLAAGRTQRRLPSAAPLGSNRVMGAPSAAL
jgi:hypothetical protein